MHKPLEGIRVLELGIFHAGPGGTAILCDMGAEVIKIEQPITGDPSRHMARYKDVDFSIGNDRNLFSEGSNRGKKSITINLASSEGKNIAYNLIKKSDVFFTNLRPGTVKKMKMDYSVLEKLSPNLIYATVSSYGSRGPDRHQGGFDYQGQGKSGFMFTVGEPGSPPQLAQFGIIDQSTAIMASYQVVLAILMRERFGIGQEIEVSLLSTASYVMYFNNLIALLTGREIPRHSQSAADPLRNYYLCKDEKWIVHTEPPNEKNWIAVCEIIGHPELAHDPRYDNRDKRIDNSKELVIMFNKAFLTRNRDEWLRLFAEKNLMICPVHTTLEAIKDPQMIENDYIVDFDHPEMGKIKIPGFPIRFSRAEINNTILAPRLGEHTDIVLKEIGEYSEEEISLFRKNKVI